MVPFRAGSTSAAQAAAGTAPTAAADVAQERTPAKAVDKKVARDVASADKAVDDDDDDDDGAEFDMSEPLNADTAEHAARSAVRMARVFMLFLELEWLIVGIPPDFY